MRLKLTGLLLSIAGRLLVQSELKESYKRMRRDFEEANKSLNHIVACMKW